MTLPLKISVQKIHVLDPHRKEHYYSEKEMELIQPCRTYIWKMLTEKGMYRRWAPKEQIIRMIQMLQMIQNLYRSLPSATHTADVWKLIFINLDVNNFLVTSGVFVNTNVQGREGRVTLWEFMLSESWGRRR